MLLHQRGLDGAELGDDATVGTGPIDWDYWSSKLGRYVDIKHYLRALEGPEYGVVAVFMQRQKASP
jgi:hypothetical protein